MTAAPVRLHLDLRQPARQTLSVRQSWQPQITRLDVQLPVWTPGSYTVRDPVQYLHSLVLRSDGEPVPLRRLTPSRWQADLPNLKEASLDYSLEARDLTVRTCHLDPSFASLCLAAVAMQIDGCRWQEHHLSVSVSSPWKVHVPLPCQGGVWVAEDFDALVDSPVHAGDVDVAPFEVDGYRHELLLIGSPPGGWPTDFKRNVEAVCSATCRLLGTAPPAGNRYQLVIQMLEKGYGGLEHDHSAVLQYSWQALARPEGLRQLLQLVGHEYFHQWNVRRLRPVEYRPYDYSRAVISEGLWFAEGITSYFDLATTLLAGLSDRGLFLKDLGDELSGVLMTPGRRIQSLATSSKEAWVKLYKATTASRDTQVSYYRLGAATAFCLDVRLRQAGASLALALRQLWTSHGCHGRGYGRDDIRASIQEHDQALAMDLDSWLDQTEALPIHACVAALGLRLDPIPCKHPHHGLTLHDDAGMVLIRRIAVDSPAADCDLVVGDELLAVGGRRLRRVADLDTLLQAKSPVSILYSRRGLVLETSLIPNDGVDRWALDWDPGASPVQLSLRDRWFEIL